MKIKKFLFLLALALLPLLLYLPTLKHELIWDDKPMILENDLLHGEFSLTAPFRSGYWASTSQRGSGYDYYRPLMVLSFMTEKAVWGLDSRHLHLVNLLIFIASLFVVYFFFRRQTTVDGVAEAAVALFAFFPLNLDSISWVVGRNDLLMLFFGLLALYLFDLFLSRRSILLGTAAIASYLLALFSKEAALFFLPVFLLHEWSRRRRPRYPIHAMFLAVSLFYWGVKSAVIGRGGVPIHLFPSLWQNVRVPLGVLGYYFRSLAFPFRYDMFLPINTVTTLANVALGFVFLSLLAMLFRLGRRKTVFMQAWIWSVPYLAGYLLFAFTPIYPYNISTRYLMLPSIGLVWLLSHGLRSLPRFFGRLVLVALLMASASTVIGNFPRYDTELNFWASALGSCPNDSFFMTKYAGQLRDSDDFVRSEVLFRRALTFEMAPSTAVTIALRLADIAFSQARYGESLGWLEKVRSLPLDLPRAQYRLTKLLKIHWARGEADDAEATVGALIALAPTEQNKTTRVNLRLAFAAWEKAEAAALQLAGPSSGDRLALIEKEKRAFQSMSPRQQSFYFLGCENFAFAWKLWPQAMSGVFADQLHAAWLAFLSGHEQEGEKRIADLAEKGKNDFRVLNSLGNLFFEMQRAGEAAAFYRLSLKLNPAQAALRERLARLDGKDG